MNDKDFCDRMHMLIHAFRSMPSYKASAMDREVSKLVIEKYKDTCDDCKIAGERQKLAPQEKKGFMNKLMDFE